MVRTVSIVEDSKNLKELLEEIKLLENEKDKDLKIFQIATLVNKIANSFFKAINDHNFKVLNVELDNAKDFHNTYSLKDKSLIKRDILMFNEEFNEILIIVLEVAIKVNIELATKIEQAMDRGLKNFTPITFN
jgi:hypothetical protein